MTWAIARQADMANFDDIKGFHNPRRRHVPLVWKSPVAFERKVAETSILSRTKAGNGSTPCGDHVSDVSDFDQAADDPL